MSRLKLRRRTRSECADKSVSPGGKVTLVPVANPIIRSIGAIVSVTSISIAGRINDGNPRHRVLTIGEKLSRIASITAHVGVRASYSRTTGNPDYGVGTVYAYDMTVIGLWHSFKLPSCRSHNADARCVS